MDVLVGRYLGFIQGESSARHFRKCPGVSCCPVLQAVVVGCDITMSRGVYGSVMRKSSREALKDSGEIAIYQAKC